MARMKKRRSQSVLQRLKDVSWGQLELFDSEAVSGTLGIRVFDVGQGDCIGVVDQDGLIFCYVDYGGLADYPDPKNAGTRLPVSASQQINRGRTYVPIILTHWDKDHYWSAKKKNTSAQKCEWLVPRQMASPTAVRFAATLQRAKCWPEKRGPRPARVGVGAEWDVEIRKCAPYSPRKVNEDRNRTGLAIALLRWSGDRVAQLILLPGDCPFHLIPELPRAAEICGLIAYHHGSRTHWTKGTKAAVSRYSKARQMAYSHGKDWVAFRNNYQPEWDGNATTTVEVRVANRKSIDIQWPD